MRKSFCSCDKLTSYDPKSWVELLLLKVFPHFDIIKTIKCKTCNGTGKVEPRLISCYLEPEGWMSDTCFDCDNCSGSSTRLYLRRYYWTEETNRAT